MRLFTYPADWVMGRLEARAAAIAALSHESFALVREDGFGLDAVDHAVLRHQLAAANRRCLSRTLAMPRISAFYGIVIYMHWREHPPPHFHAEYGSFAAKVLISTGEVFVGELPERASRLVRRWTHLHRDELTEAWGRAERFEQPKRIAPLP
jgi:hypothetical protein